MNRLANILLGVLITAPLFSCAGTRQPEPDAGNGGASATGPAAQETCLPVALPVDSLQPGELLDEAGRVVPVGAAPGGRVASIQMFNPGRLWFDGGGLVAVNGEAARLAGFDGTTSFAIYRLPLGAAKPGVFDVDANALSEQGYHVGVADYRAGHWIWHGPYSKNHIRIQLAGQIPTAEFISPLGSAFVCIVASGGALVDVVGVRVSAADAEDTVAPAAPTMPSLESFNGAVLARWNSVGDAGLAGYRVYWCSQWFQDVSGTGVRRTAELVAGEEFLIQDVALTTYVRVSAVDVSGNESSLSEFAAGAPLKGSAPPLVVEASDPSCVINQPLTVTATGAASYDFDLDGDGTPEVSGRAPGIVSLDTSGAGLRRITVWGRADDGRALARGGVSVLVLAGDPVNARPVAGLSVDALVSEEGAELSFDSSGSYDPDGSVVLYEFDLDGDRFYESSSPDVATTVHSYAGPGVYQATVRVTDDGGARDTATRKVRINEVFDSPHPWPLRGGNPRRTGRSAATGPRNSQLQWSFPAGSLVRSSPAIGEDGTVYFGCDDDHLYALSPGGGLKWKYPAGGNVSSSPAIGPDGTVYVGSWDGRLHAISPEGERKWAFATGDLVLSSPVVGKNGTVFFGSNDGKLYAVTAGGELSWEFATGGFIVSSPALAPDGTVYVGSKDNNVYAVSSLGELRWAFGTDDDVDASPAVGPDGTVYVGSWDRNLYALSPQGELLWSFRTGANIDSSPAIAADGSIYVCSRNHKLYALRPDGSFRWEFITGDGIASSPAIDNDGNIYFGSADDFVYALEPDGQLIWSHLTGGDVESSPALGADGTLYVGSLDFMLYAIGQ